MEDKESGFSALLLHSETPPQGTVVLLNEGRRHDQFLDLM